LLIREGALTPDFDDELVAKSCVVRQGEVLLKT
jgi:H+-translocating NAD(P) transhydrogenase subunit alpha